MTGNINYGASIQKTKCIEGQWSIQVGMKKNFKPYLWCIKKGRTDSLALYTHV